jgi:hypothetical protein
MKRKICPPLDVVVAFTFLVNFSGLIARLKLQCNFAVWKLLRTTFRLQRSGKEENTR